MAITKSTLIFLTALFIIQIVNVRGGSIFSGTGEVPPYGGIWYACSNFNTTYISFSLRVSNTSLDVTPNFLGTVVPGQSPRNMSKYIPALIAYEMTAGNVTLFASNVSNTSFQYIPSLSCYEMPVQSCDQDVGDLPLDDDLPQCLALQNPTAQPVYFNLSISWVKSVFVTNFTSPDVPGGHEALKNIAVSNKQVYGFTQVLICTFMVLVFSKFLH
ncbi:12023_t:CDS:2 [Dentiscutata heterogama]|uniref:12023_t:CDS:1 n=1 Tax=Dentiscutata heterogama TaxID=1316150 RepID=A0ACA9LAT8_9GLOM|nr:12023_t:CDS:2 [Dentiscutata heterogama]